ncbi:hypothetical protein B0I35DRAFT_121745 [Stachybotrys elegans]|uniref:Uncharacterized protein n=1 Tax=Stachybotrys elegans TaxID=80388 RepID=A0A8K0T2L9_9HYPO|nr:hypothetical protein B0I35DRAFT_121745 [Stachybotrys elegans]
MHLAALHRHLFAQSFSDACIHSSSYNNDIRQSGGAWIPRPPASTSPPSPPSIRSRTFVHRGRMDATHALVGSLDQTACAQCSVRQPCMQEASSGTVEALGSFPSLRMPSINNSFACHAHTPPKTARRGEGEITRCGRAVGSVPGAFRGHVVVMKQQHTRTLRDRYKVSSLDLSPGFPAKTGARHGAASCLCTWLLTGATAVCPHSLR